MSSGDLRLDAIDTPYEVWMKQQGIPIQTGFGVTDLNEHEFGYWDHLGCPAYFVQLRGMEGITGMYVAEIPAGEATKRERHLYESVIYILQGSGSTTLEAPDGRSHQFEWQEGSLFAIPLNTPHRMFAAGQTARFVAFTTAPIVFDLFYNEDFVFETPYVFKDRFNGEPSYFDLDERHEPKHARDIEVWETNFIADVRSATVHEHAVKAKDGLATQFELSNNSLIGHLAKWPTGRYHKAHHHAGGAILLIAQGDGYSTMWPSEVGERPYESGHADQVVKVDWKPGSVFSPPTGWFHQHFNVDQGPALQIALRNSSSKHPLGLRRAPMKAGVMVPTEEGGTLIEYEKEDPAVKRMFEDQLRARGVPVLA